MWRTWVSTVFGLRKSSRRCPRSSDPRRSARAPRARAGSAPARGSGLARPLARAARRSSGRRRISPSVIRSERVDEHGHVGDAVLQQVPDRSGCPRAGASPSATRGSARARARRPPGCARPISCAATRPSSVWSAACGCRGSPRRAGSASTFRSSSSAVPTVATTSTPASASSRARPSRKSASSSAITTRTETPPGS